MGNLLGSLTAWVSLSDSFPQGPGRPVGAALAEHYRSHRKAGAFHDVRMRPPGGVPARSQKGLTGRTVVGELLSRLRLFAAGSLPATSSGSVRRDRTIRQVGALRIADAYS
jgi:hypothetical protein